MNMPDIKKVINGLEYCMSESLCYKCPYKSEDECENGKYYYSKAIEDAITLLKEQEPVKPVVDAIDGWYRCGKCGNLLASDKRIRLFGLYKWPVYCKMCGKKVKWGE